MPTLRRLILPVAAAAAAACVHADGSGNVNIPEGAIVYKIAPHLLRDEFVDTSAGQSTGLSWLPTQGFVGYNCFGLTPRSPTDTTGTFVFGWAGPNTGRVERRIFGITDTVTGYFIDVDPPGGTGTYAVDQTGKLTLFWSNGARTRYFAPSAVLRLYGDTIESTADLRAKADSIRDQWHVYWTFDDRCS